MMINRFSVSLTVRVQLTHNRRFFSRSPASPFFLPPDTFYKSTSCSGKDALSEVLLRSVTDSMNTIKNVIFSLFPTYPVLLFTKVQIHVNTRTPALSDLIIGHDFKSNSDLAPLVPELAYTPQ